LTQKNLGKLDSYEVKSSDKNFLDKFGELDFNILAGEKKESSQIENQKEINAEFRNTFIFLKEEKEELKKRYGELEKKVEDLKKEKEKENIEIYFGELEKKVEKMLEAQKIINVIKKEKEVFIFQMIIIFNIDSY
jgi:ABC-type phosphate transport system auxiliary subunit